MIDYCYCEDDETPLVYKVFTPKAKKNHKCCECDRQIKPGENYESIFLIQHRRAHIFATCSNCLNLREYIRSHVPCFCFAHRSLIKDAIEAAQSYRHESPGFLFGAYRRLVTIKRAKKISA